MGRGDEKRWRDAGLRLRRVADVWLCHAPPQLVAEADVAIRLCWGRATDLAKRSSKMWSGLVKAEDKRYWREVVDTDSVL